ncbi:flagellar basal-body rod protein FlgG [Persephonella hydrogeniphila]|uniref:Flagellar basal-body rod protein FlgG n=1 Tax=Persephonella hydrogeniphila TaxID=198703 RepID=A0A285NF47_9AQUI|nr:flagellar hook-basal body protein [Persephonella hydrogeniphila]SNZ08134.1 flagellar basal-body rod protein FlgG [Persephonella hydrogeniphila]
MALNFQPIYILASGGERALENLNVVTNNLANVNTPGFKKLLLREMSQYLPENKGDSSHLFVFPRFNDTPVINTQGNLIKTDAPFDLAIFGKGFFGIETPNGIKYTRNGHFLRNGEGFLVDSNGNYLLNEQGKRIRITDITKPINILDDGTVYSGNEVVGKIMVRNFSSVRPDSESYYIPDNNAQEIPAEYQIKQGYLEQSNVNGIEAMIELINAQRRFEIYGNLMRSLDQMEQKSNEIGRA